MAIYPREDPRTALPQLEKRIAELEEEIKMIGENTTPVEIKPTYHQCTAGSYNGCYKVGRMVFLAFNINITTATTSYDYLEGIPPAIGLGWACAGVINNASTVRFWVTPQGTLRADGTTVTGWVNGSVVYITKE